MKLTTIGIAAGILTGVIVATVAAAFILQSPEPTPSQVPPGEYGELGQVYPPINQWVPNGSHVGQAPPGPGANGPPLPQPTF